MRKLFGCMFLLAAAGALALGIQWRDGRTDAASPPPPPPAPEENAFDTKAPYQSVVTINQTRVTLLSVGQDSIFKWDDAGKVTRIPMLQILYLVEDLSKEPIKTWNEKQEILVNGKPISTAFSDHYGYDVDKLDAGPWTDFRSENAENAVSAVANPKRAEGHRIWIEGKIPSGTATIVLYAGINDKPEVFRFENIPLR